MKTELTIDFRSFFIFVLLKGLQIKLNLDMFESFFASLLLPSVNRNLD